MFWSSAIFTFFTFTLQSKLFKFHFHCRPRTNCKIVQYLFEIWSNLFNQALWWILIQTSELGVVYAGKKWHHHISTAIMQDAMLKTPRSFPACLALNSTSQRQDWMTTQKQDITVSSPTPFPLEVKKQTILNRPWWCFVIFVERLLWVRKECSHTRLTCTQSKWSPCHAQSARKSLKPSLLLRSTQQPFIGT